jgi:hypoxanthine phosphoribosyltransferase
MDSLGFETPDLFVPGYELDFAERYRNLPFVGVLYPRVYKQVCKRLKNTLGRKSGGQG